MCHLSVSFTSSTACPPASIGEQRFSFQCRRCSGRPPPGERSCHDCAAVSRACTIASQTSRIRRRGKSFRRPQALAAARFSCWHTALCAVPTSIQSESSPLAELRFMHEWCSRSASVPGAASASKVPVTLRSAALAWGSMLHCRPIKLFIKHVSNEWLHCVQGAHRTIARSTGRFCHMRQMRRRSISSAPRRGSSAGKGGSTADAHQLIRQRLRGV